MLFPHLAAASLATFFALAAATPGPLPANHYLWGQGNGPTRAKRSSVVLEPRDQSCTNGPTTRGCWTNGYSIATDYDLKYPTTGRTQSYHWSITEVSCNPDGASPGRICQLVNGQFPGPTLYANWGDYISVTITNNMKDNGTGIHWHGVRQLNTNTMDGVGGITECPIAPGQSTTYTFQATQFGTSWYHSHHSAQYGNGLLGSIVINGPTTANYDYDLGPFGVTDWYYNSVWRVDDIWEANLQNQSPGPSPDTILINGRNVGPTGGGSYTIQTLSPGKKHKIRLINTSVDNSIRVSLDSHIFQVVAADFVPIQPFYTNWILLGIGQRYDIIINANQTVGNYWMRAEPEAACLSSSNTSALAIFHYSGAPAAKPTSTAAPAPGTCLEASGHTLIPYVPNTAGNATQFSQQAKQLPVNINLPGTQTNQQNVVTWGINMTAIDVLWQTPTLSFVANGTTNYPTYENVIAIPNEGIWTYWVVQEVTGTPAIPHPMHLHGHDFYILGSGPGYFNMTSGPATLTYQNPPRRDTAFLPAGGWLVLAFLTDNPGAWLMHCHIAWHISEGLGVQFLEAASKIRLPGQSYQNQCAQWSSFYSTSAYTEPGSGL